MEWTVSSFINGRPIEEYTEEVDAFFRRAWGKALKSLGYEPFIDQEELEKLKRKREENQS